MVFWSRLQKVCVEGSIVIGCSIDGRLIIETSLLLDIEWKQLNIKQLQMEVDSKGKWNFKD